MPGPNTNQRYVVGIGASAGGLEAIQLLFDHVRPDTELAFVVVQHLSPDFKSLMDELLARHTTLPIHVVEHGTSVEAGHIYLLPAGKGMVITNGLLLLSDRDRTQRPLPIDVFFESLAVDCGPRAAAIVLSGTGSDGALGIRDVHAAGGLVIVQELSSAQFDGMPEAALATGIADWIARPEEMSMILEDRLARGRRSST